MPSASDHEELAAQDEAFSEALAADPLRSRWAMTAMFYSAVHAVQAVSVRRGWRVKHKGVLRYPEDHGERLQVVSRKLSEVETEYRALKEWSEAARYEGMTFSETQLALARAQLAAIKNHIESLPSNDEEGTTS